MTCLSCHTQVHPTTQPVPHLTLLVLSVLSCGLVLPLWIGATIGAGMARTCPACGVAL